MGDVATQNLFALLGDEGEDPLANLSEAKPDKAEKKKPASAAPAEGRPGAGVAARLGGNNNAQQGGRGAAEGRGRGRGPARGRGGYSGARRDDAQDVSADAEASTVSRGDNGYRGRGGGGGYRGRGGRGGDDRRPAKHEYERRDASGRGNEIEKKHGAGRGNWGDQREELVGVTDKPAEAVTGAPLAEAAEEAAVAAGGDPADGPTAEEIAEAEAKEMTLDEYEAMLAEKRGAKKESTAPKVDMKQFEGMNVSQARKDKKEDEAENELDLKNRRGPKAQKEKPLKEKQTVEANFRVGEDSNFSGGGRGRGGRGGRGGRFEGGGYGGGRGRSDYGGGRGQEAANGFRGGYEQGYGGRGGGRGGRGTNINVDDQSAFPTLG